MPGVASYGIALLSRYPARSWQVLRYAPRSDAGSPCGYLGSAQDHGPGGATSSRDRGPGNLEDRSSSPIRTSACPRLGPAAARRGSVGILRPYRARSC